MSENHSTPRTESTQPAEDVLPSSKAEDSIWSWMVPAMVGVLLGKVLGLVGVLVFIGPYLWLQPKMGWLRAALISFVAALVVSVGVRALIA